MKELEDTKLELEDTEKKHRNVITRLEKKFFSEKIRLQKEANKKIGDLAAQAHRVESINKGSCFKFEEHNKRCLQRKY